MDWLSQMKPHYNQIVPVPLWVVVITVVMVVLAGVLFGLFTTENDRLIALWGGLAGGLVVYIIGFLREVYHLRQLDYFWRMGIRDILNTRHDVVYYGNIISKAKSEVLVTGTSCHRFINDFLDLGADDKALVDQLRQFPKLRIRFLIPCDSFMDFESKTKFDLVRPKLERLQSKFPSRVELRRFGDIARLSMVVVDDELIAGPVLPGIESRQAPAVHVSRLTEYGKKHIDYFEEVWERSDGG